MIDTQKLMRYEANKKSAGVGYLLLILFSGLGVHRFYLGKSGSGATMLILTILGFVLTSVGIGLLMLLVVGLWVFIDLFLIPGMAREYNNHLVDSLA